MRAPTYGSPIYFSYLFSSLVCVSRSDACSRSLEGACDTFLRSCKGINCDTSPQDFRCQARRQSAAMLCALEGLATKHGGEKTRNFSQVIALQFLSASSRSSLRSKPFTRKHSAPRSCRGLNRNYFSIATRYLCSMAANSARVALPFGSNRLFGLPLMMPCMTSALTGSFA